MKLTPDHSHPLLQSQSEVEAEGAEQKEAHMDHAAELAKLMRPAPTDGTTTPRTDAQTIRHAANGGVLHDTITDLRAQLATLQSRLAEVEKDLTNIKDWAHTQTEGMRGQMSNAVANLAAAEAALVQAKQEGERAKNGGREWCRIANNALTELDSLRAANTALQEQVERLTEVQRSANIHHGKDNQKLVVPTDDAGRAVYWKARALAAEGQRKAEPILPGGWMTPQQGEAARQKEYADLFEKCTALSAQVEELKRDGERATKLLGEASDALYDALAEIGLFLGSCSDKEIKDSFMSLKKSADHAERVRNKISAARAHAKQSGEGQP